MAATGKLISLCMIVKNEERLLARCLNSAKGIADEIIVVDTGSEDRTVEIAESFGARVLRIPWEHDFAKARNAGADEASGEWILFLDADEELDPAAGGELLAYAAMPDCDGLLLQIWNRAEDERAAGGTMHPVLRMYRRAPGRRFEGRIHEQIAASIARTKPDARFVLTNAVIHHYGYSKKLVNERGKLARNRELLLKAIEEEPDNVFHRYNIGVEWLRGGEAEAALGAFRAVRRFSGFGQLNYAHLVIKYEALSLLFLSREAEALAVCAEGLRFFPDYTDLRHLEALALARLGRLKEAAAAAEDALKRGAPPPHYHTERGIGTFRTAYMLGRIYEASGDGKGVLRAYTAALAHRPDLLPPLFRLCRYVRVTAVEERLPAILASRLTCTGADAVLKVALIMRVTGASPETAEAWVEWHAHAMPLEDAATLRDRWRGLAEGRLAMPAWLAAKQDGSGTESGAQELYEQADEWLGRLKNRRSVQAVRLMLPCREGWEQA